MIISPDETLDILVWYFACRNKNEKGADKNEWNGHSIWRPDFTFSVFSVYGSIFPEMTQNDSSDVFVSPCSNLRL